MIFKREIRTFADPKPDKGFEFKPEYDVTDQRSPFTTPSLLVFQYLQNNPQPPQDEDEEVLDIQPYDDISDYGADIQALGGREKILKQNQKTKGVTSSQGTN